MYENYDINMIDPMSNCLEELKDEINSKSTNLIIDINNIYDINEITPNCHKTNDNICNNGIDLCSQCSIKMIHCSRCDAYFNRKTSFDNHFNHCKEVKREDKIILTNNSNNSNNSIKFRCQICKKSFDNMDLKEFQVHQNICMNSLIKKPLPLNNNNNIKKEEQPFLCIFCNLKFDKSKEKEFIEHCYQKCGNVSKSIEVKAKASNKIAKVANVKDAKDAKDILKCPKCNIEFESTELMEYHNHFINCSSDTFAELLVECIYCHLKINYLKIEDHEDKCKQLVKKIEELDNIEKLKSKDVNQQQNIVNIDNNDSNYIMPYPQIVSRLQSKFANYNNTLYNERYNTKNYPKTNLKEQDHLLPSFDDVVIKTYIDNIDNQKGK